MELLERIYGYEGLTRADLQKIFDAHTKVTFERGDFILKAGEQSNEYYCLQKGLVRSYVMDYNGHDITTEFFGEGQIIIEVNSLFQRIPSQENFQALTDCVCWKIEFAAFQQLYHEIEMFSEWGRAWMAQALFYFKHRSVSMITQSATDRYLSLMQERPQILRDAPLKTIASYLGITDTSLSRIRKEITKVSAQ
ncbi:MAG TPA: Crp/Fnr family transcriptional regulator [Flavobacteriales bacterium]